MVVVCSKRDGKRPCKSCTHCDKTSRNIHPDITEVKKLDNKQIITVDQIRELKQDVYIVPNEAMQKAYIVRDADTMNTNAQNAFLHILEEPPAHAVFILCTENPAALLPTVRSRCVELKSRTADTPAEDTDDLDELDELAENFIESLTGDNVKLIKTMFLIDKLDRYELNTFLTLTLNKVALALREATISGKNDLSKKLIHAESVIIKAGEMLGLNVSSGNIAGYICANMMKF